MRLYEAATVGDCTPANLAAEGTASAFESPGLTATVPEDSTTTFRASAEDPAGNVSACSEPLEYTEDSTPPTNPSLSSPSHTVEAPSGDPTIEVAFSGAADSLSGLDGFSFEWDTSPATLPDTTKDAEQDATATTGPALADGSSHYFHLRSRDNAGNWSGAVHLGPFVIDTQAPDETAPETTIETGPSGPISDPTPTFAFSADEDPVTFECQVDEGGFTPCTSPHTTASLEDGPHSFEVRATDAAENTDQSPAKREFTVDTSQPEPSEEDEGESEPSEPESVPPPFVPAVPVFPVDETPPNSALFGPRRQVAGRAIAVRAKCNEPCVVSAAGRIVVWRGGGRSSARAQKRRVRIALRRVEIKLVPGQIATVRLRPQRRRADRRLRRLVQRGWKARALVGVRSSDSAGSATVERVVVDLRAARRRS